MAQSNQIPSKDTMNAALEKGAGVAPEWTYDVKGNPFGWLRLNEPGTLADVARALAEVQARLMTVTAFAESKDDEKKRRAIAYHFTCDRAVATVIVPLYHPDTLEELPVPSITPWFRNADWNEREFHEMFDITITGHPNPKRLFLDERLDAGIMTQLIPYSSMVHGASSKVLWEKVMEAKLGVRPARNAVEQEPRFTPVSSTEDQAVPLKAVSGQGSEGTAAKEKPE